MPRLHAFRPDLADARLKGEVAAERFVAGRPARIAAPVADVRKAPRPDAGINTQLLLGDDVLVFDEAEGWAWVQAERDGYVGYVAADHAGRDATMRRPTSSSVPRTFLYPGPDLQLSARAASCRWARRSTVTGAAETRGTRYAAACLRRGDHRGPSAAGRRSRRRLCRGGRDASSTRPISGAASSGFGIDCSGLVQLAMRMAGRDVLRDSDMQAATHRRAARAGPGLCRACGAATSSSGRAMSRS